MRRPERRRPQLLQALRNAAARGGRYQLGVIRERLDDDKGAVECFERVVEANPRDSSAHYHLGLGYKRLGLEGLAMSAFAEALRLDPSDTAAAEELQSLQR